MCKLFVLTKTQDLTETQLKKLIRETSKELLVGNSDGFGYSIATSQGFYGERFTETNSMSFSHFGERSNINGPSDEYIFGDEIQNSFGVKSPHSGGLIVHARTSTNKLGLVNTHPFNSERYSLVHNGVVDNVGVEVDRVSDNDSEYILRHYDSGGIDNVVNSVSGYYALGILDADTGNTIVVRDATANLYGAYFKSIDAYAFATTKKTLEIASKVLKSKCVIREVKTNTAMVFSREGILIETITFTPKEKSFGRLDEMSLGRSYESLSWRDDIPSYRQYDDGDLNYVNAQGMPISEEDYELLTWAEQSNCSVYKNGKLIA